LTPPHAMAGANGCMQKTCDREIFVRCPIGDSPFVRLRKVASFDWDSRHKVNEV
jgi:hypothetical protein